ncbi:fatty acid metabolism transcriptional regulator FadR [Acanthopleuribacter pedis]|uniref:Fatty acid metabolism transcriptional regulator FadR n=2 Tax=Acanthopleuribacter pedis TaxID=442870 RepID=A0A8J7QJB6_9BACT|nr:fatty acid metabolism transcriptional regulator FadR [Acanthopleuribacter pedis]
MTMTRPANKPAAVAEQTLIRNFLDGTYRPGDHLPAERRLAVALGLTRPTLREALQRLDRDGWITIRQGKPTVVNDFWRHGGLNVLNAMVNSGADLNPDFVTQLLEVRRTLAPAYVADAVRLNGEGVVQACAARAELSDDAEAYCDYDWHTHHRLAVLSNNIVYPLILNGFKSLYLQLGAAYFTLDQTRGASAAFYGELEHLARNGDSQAAADLAENVMAASIQYWKHMIETQ